MNIPTRPPLIPWWFMTHQVIIILGAPWGHLSDKFGVEIHVLKERSYFYASWSRRIASLSMSLRHYVFDLNLVGNVGIQLVSKAVKVLGYEHEVLILMSGVYW